MDGWFKSEFLRRSSRASSSVTPDLTSEDTIEELEESNEQQDTLEADECPFSGTSFDSIVDDLSKRSRLHDGLEAPGFLATASPNARSYVYFRGASGFDYLQTAYKKVQKLLYDTVRARWPDIHLAHYRDGPHAVRLGRDELHRVFGGEHIGCSDLAANSAESSWRLKDAIMDNVDLRNAVCHPSERLQNSWSIDVMLKSAQRLAVCLEDGAIMMDIRALRDDLAKEARQTLRDFEESVALASLPFAGTLNEGWEAHHERHFSGALHDWSRGRECSDEVLALALQWRNWKTPSS
ncbi:Uu.00g100360.m01.CDS01 [Anthostomella pinea]|uniref:Uu.00g100360.m01.CDS01 n=1 Tax=Anthostomella pinea TaxID=933095 RepID=A0AAI8VD15_9PEZI|nr:Uu.00g100360.m01.CDS01 [Anthostomella pinea]